MEIRILKEPIRKTELADLARAQFGDMVKAVVDVAQGRVAIGGELHADDESLLLDAGSRQEDLWGINLYPDMSDEEWVEFDSMINIRPSLGNRSRGVELPAVREKIMDIIKKWVVD